MNKRFEMMCEDSILAKAILEFTTDLDKAYEIFVELHEQDSWRISDIERLLH